MRHQPAGYCISEDVDVTHKKTSSENQRRDCDVHRIPDVAVESLDHQVLRWKDGRRRADTLKRKTCEGFKQDGDACSYVGHQLREKA